MVHQGVLTFDQAEAVIASYKSKRDYDNPVPMNLLTALEQTCEVIHGEEDDEAIADMLAGDPEIDVELDDELDVDGALSLWYGFRALLQSVQE